LASQRDSSGYIKCDVSESHIQVQIHKQLCDKFPVRNVLKQDGSSLFLCDFARGGTCVRGRN